MIPFDLENGLYRGAKPSCDEVRDCGIKAALDLESGSQVIGDDLPLVEAMVFEAVGCRVWSHPLGGIGLPTLAELRLAVQFLKIQKARGIRTLVHCKHGHERTGLVVAAYQVLEQKRAPLDAAKECLQQGMHWVYWPWLIQLWRIQ